MRTSDSFLTIIVLLLVTTVLSKAPFHDPTKSKKKVSWKNCHTSRRQAEANFHVEPAKPYTISIANPMPATITAVWKARIGTQPDMSKTLIKDGQGDTRLTFPAMCCIAGTYIIDVNLFKGQGSKMKIVQAQAGTCYLKMLRKIPKAVISGGSKLTRSSNKDVVLDGRKSQGFSYNLNYQWRCTEKPMGDFCKGFSSSQSNVTIPAKYVKPGVSFTVTLTVNLKYGKGTLDPDLTRKSTAQQQIDIIAQAATLKINCMKNCPTGTDFPSEKVKTVLTGSCETSCSFVNVEDFVWTIEEEDRPGTLHYNYQENTEFGNTGEKFILKPSTLQPLKYVITLALNKKARATGETQFRLEFEPVPVFVYCMVSPSSGFSMETEFTFTCQMKKDNSNIFFKVLDPEGRPVVKGTSPGVFREPFPLPVLHEQPLTIRAYSKSKSFSEYKVTVDVRMHENQTKEDIIDDINQMLNKTKDNFKAEVKEIPTEKVPEEIPTENPEGEPPEEPPDETPQEKPSRPVEDITVIKSSKSINGMRQVIEKAIEYNNASGNDTLANVIADLKQSFTGMLMNREAKSQDEILDIGSSYTDLLSQNPEAQVDTSFDQEASTVCRQLSSGMLNFLKNDEAVLDQDDEAMKAANIMSKCVTATTHPSTSSVASKIKPEEDFVDVPEGPVPTDYDKIVEEHYEDYEYHDEDYYKKLDALTVTTSNLLNMTSTTAKVMALTTAVGEAGKQFGNDNVKIVAIKDLGKHLANMTVRCKGDVVIPSRDLEDKPDHSFDILISNFEYDIMWWNEDLIRTATNTLNLEVWHSACEERIREFKKPVKVIFGITRAFSEGLLRGVFKIPKNFSWTETASLVRVYRVTLPKDMELRITFNKLADANQVFDTVITQFRLATVEDFKTNVTKIGRSKRFVHVSNTDNEDAWYYLSFVPIKATFAKTNKRKLRYSISIRGATCMRWKMSASRWEIACTLQPSPNDSIVTCNCYKFSVIAGYVGQLGIVPQIFNVFKAKLSLQVSCVVFYSTLCVFVVYCLLLMFTTIKEKRPFYYLADNIKSHEYFYLVIVKTSIWPNAGTTSNVCIKLYGEALESEKHLLNYPDPEKRMLQKGGEDLFLLCTKDCLGPITKIDLWSDNIGTSATWKCAEILINDLQNNEKFYFLIDKILSSEYKTQFISSRPIPNTKENIFGLRNLKIITRNHTWFIWEDRGETFTYMKRLTVLLSTVLLEFSFTLLAHGNPGFVIQDALEDFSKYKLDVFTASIGCATALGSFVLHISMSYTFEWSKIQFSQYGKQVVPMPFMVTLSCWSLLITLILASSTHLLIFGFWLPHFTSLRWLTSSLFGLVADVCVYEAVVLFFRNFLPRRKLQCDILNQTETMLREIERQRSWMHQAFGSKLFRGYFEQVYVPLNRTQVKEMGMQMRLRKLVVHELQDLVMFSIYVIVLFVIVLINRQPLAVVSKINVENILHGKHSNRWSLGKTTSMIDIYTYTQKVLIPSTQPKIWYGDFVLHEPGLIVDAQNKILGVVRLRQLRMSMNICSVPDVMQWMNLSCSPEFSSSNAERGTFGYGWGPFDRFLLFDRLRKIWEYQTDSAGTQTYGDFLVYPSGGYMAYMGRTLYNSLVNFRTLKKKFWIDPHTRAICVEFLTYNVNYNIFNSVSLLLEQSASGLLSKTITIEVSRMVFVHREVAKVVTIITIFFGIWVGMIFMRLSLGMMRNFRSIARDPWIIIDFCIICMSAGSITLEELRTRKVGDYLSKLEKSRHNEFLSYFYLFYLDGVMTIIASVLICVATVRLWKFFRFGVMFRTVEKALVLAALPLAIVGLCFLVILFSFGTAGSMLYGSHTNEFHKIIPVASTLFTMIFQPATFRPITKVFSYHAYPYFIFYMLTMQVILSFFIATIILAYFQAQVEVSNEERGYNIKDYLNETTRWIPAIVKYKCRRLRGGKRDKEEVEEPSCTPKPDELRYANSIAISQKRLEVMRFVSIAALARNQPRKKTPNFGLMTEIAVYFTVGEKDTAKKDAFFKGRLEGVNLKFVAEKNIGKVAAAVNKIAVVPDKSHRKKVKKKKNPVLEKYLNSLKELHRCIIGVRNDVNELLSDLDKF